MTARSLNIILSILAVLQVLWVGAKADVVSLRGSAFEITTSLEDFIKLNDRQHVEQVASHASRMTEFRAGYQRELDTIKHNRDFIEMILLETDQKLYPLEILNDTTKHCVQRYSSLLVSKTTVRSAFSACLSQAASALTSILSLPDSTHRSLSNYYIGNWKSGLTNCANKNKDSYANHTNCVTQLVATTNTYFMNNQRSFTTQMDASRCSADTRIRTAVECVFPTMNNSLRSDGEATRMIDDCISGIQLCKPCQQEQSNNTAIISDRTGCPNVIDIKTNSETYRSATIRNPFYGMSSTMDCILINFLKPTVTLPKTTDIA